MQASLKIVRAVAVAACLAVLALVAWLPTAYATASDEVVRVGYYRGDPRFQDGFDDEARKSGYAYDYYQELSALAGWDYEYVYGTRTEILDKLVAGDVDIVAGIYRTDEREDKMLFSEQGMGLDGRERYFAVALGREDLLAELDWAQEKLLSTSPDLTLTLYQKYYNHDDDQQELTLFERAYLVEKGPIRVGYIKDNLPLSGQSEDGSPVGVVAELVDYLQGYLGVLMVPVCYDSVTLMEEGLLAGEIDVAFPVYSDLWLAESKGFYQTDPVVSDRVMIVFLGDYRDDLMDRIAMTEHGIGQPYYLATYYPDSRAVTYPSMEESFAAVQRGEVDSMMGCSSVLQCFLAGHPEYRDYHVAYLDVSEEFGMTVNRSDNRLVGILNKGIHQLGTAAVTSAMIQYSSGDPTYTLMGFVQHNSLAVIVMLVLFFSILLAAFIGFRRKTARFNREQAETRTALETALASANAASEAKSTFLSNMSHDIRTPMNGIIGMTAIAAAHIDDTARVRDCLAKITFSSKHLLALINEVLDMSKIESGEMHLTEDVIDLPTLMDELITLNQPAADAKRHEIVTRVENVVHEQVLGDSVRIQQVFTNLVGNAIKYTPEEGTIEITLAEKPTTNPRRGLFEFSVRDSGIGMSEEYLPHLFEAFSRGEGSTVARNQGTGLGLTIARNIVRMMDGDISVQSAVGEGSTFTVTLPLKLCETQDMSTAGDFVDLAALVVDDDQIACESACVLLDELGMRSEWVLSGREAVERVVRRREDGDGFFVVLVDWKMPGMDGVATTREIRRRVGNDVPIVIITAYDWSDIEAEAREAGVNGFIGKPLFKSRLAHVFSQLSGGEAAAKEPELEVFAERAGFTGKRALLAEDNEMNAEIAMEILGMSGLAVDWVPNGREAVERFEASAPGYYDCVFMDVQMPVMNGIEAAKAIRASSHPDASAVPIFAMTANAFVEDVQAVLGAGMNEHIAKPLDLDVLLRVLNEYLGKKDASR